MKASNHVSKEFGLKSAQPSPRKLIATQLKNHYNNYKIGFRELLVSRDGDYKKLSPKGAVQNSDKKSPKFLGIELAKKAIYKRLTAAKTP